MICCDCKKEVKKAHFNRKRCDKCAFLRARKPKHNLTKLQQSQLKTLVGKMDKKDIARKIGASVTSVARYAAENGITLNFHNKYKKNPELVCEVIDYYIEHGKQATKEKYPSVNFRSLIEGYAKEKRQVRWEDWEVIQLAKFAGVISHRNQAAYFNRPNAHAGSIKSAWSKKFKASSSNINGVSFYMVKPLLRKPPTMIETQFGAGNYTRKLILWVELEKCLKREVPDELVSAIKTMAKFQRWLHGKNVYFKIHKMLGEM